MQRDPWVEHVLALQSQGKPHEALKEIEKARGILHEIGETYVSRGWAFLKEEIERLASLDTRLLFLADSKEKAWDMIQRAKGAQAVLDLEAVFVDQKDALTELYLEITKEFRNAEADPSSSPGRDVDSSSYLLTSEDR